MKSIIKHICLPFLLLLIACLFITGCDNNIYHWKVEKELDEISKIEIAEIENSRIQSVICVIDKADFKEIIDDIEAMEAKKYGWNLSPAFGKCILISFTDGTCDVIALSEPQHMYYMENGSLNGKITWLTFDKNAFDKLIEKWTTK